ncbi:DUF1667 domain-containing protein [Thermosediminibacter litoriperuensis]|uniref:CxxC motif-containing protein n=1 Tax=Thermosediminibacter litoriperuensis TaxID=291989 RepID=A0A5S5AYA1_9FIRM|nr:DUF1667 domain-containing protein [Thermosediminibacter litoriperuensis]TYP58847.1 CxxC motif-containing protein [Thermosediminibacter litoriperuensis]
MSAANEERTVTCIVCPSGCRIKVGIEGSEIVRISGNQCKRGADYARAEVTQPMRVLTTTVRLEDGRLLPVKTASPIPKVLLFDAVKELSGVRVKAPVKIGQVIYSNVAGTGVDVVTTRSWN